MGVMRFSAVVTTGIYCHPGCSARPDAANVRPYESAAAAEAAGFRACLRCRPYRLTTSLTATGPELVCRATHLISDGLLDTGTEGDLAARLGVSARHLRRLFAEHVGASPDQLARSRRTHFARRLLDDTDLTVTDIAYASGFGSLRQLNRACQEVFRSSPQRAPGAAPLHGPPGGRRRAHPPPALRGPARLGHDARLLRSAGGTRRGERGCGVYRRTIVVDGAPGVLEIGYGGADHLLLAAHLPRCRRAHPRGAAGPSDLRPRPRPAPGRHTWPATRSSGRWCTISPACGCPAPGTRSRPACGPSSASR